MNLLQKHTQNGENTQELEWAKFALRLLIGGVVFAVVKVSSIALLVFSQIPVMNTNLNSELSAIAFGLYVLDGMLITAVISFLATRLPYRPWVRFLAIFVPFFWIDAGGNTLELQFFSTYQLPAIINTWIDSIVVTLLIVGAFTWLFPAAERYRGAPGLFALLGKRSLWSWAWRSLLVALLYIPAYLTFGSLIYPLVRPYYTNPAYGLNLTTPSLGTLLVLELVRGLLYVVALLPVLAVTRGSRWQTLWYVFVFLGMFNAWQLAVNLSWPVSLRFGHAAEITGDVSIQALCFCWLLTLKFKSPKHTEAAAPQHNPEVPSASTSQETSG